jgi:hypothetical protein
LGVNQTAPPACPGDESIREARGKSSGVGLETCRPWASRGREPASTTDQLSGEHRSPPTSTRCAQRSEGGNQKPGPRLVAAALLAALPGHASAEGKLRIAEQFGVSYLPLHVIRDQGLIEKHGKAQGVDAAGAVDPLHLEDTNTYYRLQPDGTFAYAEFLHPVGDQDQGRKLEDYFFDDIFSEAGS